MGSAFALRNNKRDFKQKHDLLIFLFLLTIYQRVFRLWIKYKGLNESSRDSSKILP